ncbi:hypothetical protein SAMN04487905_103283 [Actinopolyspora xinjiangensis]|uniref:Uncharacterized protein n=1 Tax=Actinopolyspora xinjiangensis TaxID=405564 RepID=A0A1H0RZG3_9ACTN|nr:hypothetical protein SAMN04487905_103283 [Actinopolyspora xinjiangensis]
MFDRSGRPARALPLTGVETRFRAVRQSELGTLPHEAHVLSNAMRAPEHGTRLIRTSLTCAPARAHTGL